MSKQHVIPGWCHRGPVLKLGLWQCNIDPWEVLCPAIFGVKTRVCGGCSVSRAQKTFLRSILFCICLKLVPISLTAAELAQSVGRMTAEREVLGSMRGACPTLRVLKSLRNDGTSFALHVTRTSRGSDDRVKWRSRFQLELLVLSS